MKQRIDHSNYEAWLLDRLEGNLTAEQERELSTFLAIHPELDPGDGDLPTVNDQAQKLSALDKEALKRRLPPVAQVDPLNVEDHLIARLESDLSKEQVEALRTFLVHHPEHVRAERLYALTKLVPEAMAFAHKQAMVRDLPPQGMPTRFTVDDFLVARLEGELSPVQETALSAYLRNDSAAVRSWKLMQATRAEAELMSYPDKGGLKKGGRVIAITSTSWMVRLAAAASIALLLGMAWWWSRSTTPGVQVADGNESVAPAKSEVKRQELNDSLSPVPVPGTDQSLKESSTREEYQRQQERREEPAFAPMHEEPLPIAEQRNITPGERPQAPVPQNVQVPVVPQREEEALATNGVAPAPQQTEANTLGQTLAATLRERVLDEPGRDVRPLDGNDAVAAVDKGLKAVGGERAGLTVARDGTGRNRGFNLRLGRNLAISASR